MDSWIEPAFGVKEQTMQSEVLKLLEGLTPSQVKEFRRRIVPALENIRREVTAEPAAKSSNGKPSGGKSDAMYSDNSKRQAV